MIQIFAALLALLTLSSAHAEIFDVRGMNQCTDPNQSISPQDLQSYLNSVPTINGCDIYKTTFIESLSSAGLPPQEDGYDGPMLYVTVVKTDRNPEVLAFDVVAIRADKSLCMMHEEDSSTSLFYRLDYGVGSGMWDYMAGNSKTVSQRITMKFAGNSLTMMSHEVITTSGRLISSKDQTLFQCGTAPTAVGTP